MFMPRWADHDSPRSYRTVPDHGASTDGVIDDTERDRHPRVPPWPARLADASLGEAYLLPRARHIVTLHKHRQSVQATQDKGICDRRTYLV